jgi:hypothetical protein
MLPPTSRPIVNDIYAIDYGRRWGMVPEVNVLALIKGDERYVYVYDDDSRADLLAEFNAQAADPQLSLNWFDAAILTQKAHEQANGEPASSASPAEPARRF